MLIDMVIGKMFALPEEPTNWIQTLPQLKTMDSFITQDRYEHLEGRNNESTYSRGKCEAHSGLAWVSLVNKLK